MPIKERPRVLLVNDDGIQSQGLAILEQQVRAFTDDVWVVAPQFENSGGGHSVSLDSPIRARELSKKRFAVSGTPTDCVLLAYWELMDEPPDIVISGINHGENLGSDMTYSGTMGAAIEAALNGVPAIALSQKRSLGKLPDFTSAETAGSGLLQSLLQLDWQPGQIVNVNYPVQISDDGAPHVRRLGNRPPGTFTPLPGTDGRNIPFYWVQVKYHPGEQPEDTDLHAIDQGLVTVTGLTVDLTSRQFNRQLEQHLNDKI